jgi:AcrR family transcriptional regulator
VKDMGVAERKERHKEDLKKDILTAAKQLFTEKGFEATSIRAIAEKIEYSPATIYLYYKDKNEIVHALHQDGFNLLMQHFSKIDFSQPAFARLIALGRAYMQFAFEHPDVYTLIFSMKEPMQHVTDCEKEWHEGDRAFSLLYKTVEECKQEGYFKDMESVGMSFMIWSAMHGLCTLRTSGHLEHMALSCAEVTSLKMDVNTLLDHNFETFIKLLEKLKN